MSTNIKGDFIGFSFGGTHSTDLGIVRTSDGSRYNENLLPTIQEKTIQVPGGDGTYFFGTYYTQKPFSISIAYDNLTEEDVKNIKFVFGAKEPKKLIFDEHPYKYYWAKCTGTPNLKFICFSDSSKINEQKPNGEPYKGEGRLYKGEGTLTFTCYDPFGYSESRWLEGLEKIGEGYWEPKINQDDWLEASGLLTEGDWWNRGIEDLEDKNATPIGIQDADPFSVTVENWGNLETDWILIASPLNKEKTLSFSMKMNGVELRIKELKMAPEDSFVKIDSKLNLVQGLDEVYGAKNNIYNEFLFGSFSRLPIGDTEIVFSNLDNCKIELFKFHYKYF